MNIKRHLRFASAGLVCLVAPALANAGSGFYIGAGAGGATVESNLGDSGLPNIPTDIDLDEDDTATKFFVGYTFDLPFVDLAAELGYVNFGEPELDIAGDEFTQDTTGFNAWGIATLNAGLIDLYGKLGLIAWEAEQAFQGFDRDEDGTDVAYGIGAAFGLGPLEVRGEYEVYDLDDSDISMISVGLIYRF